MFIVDIMTGFNGDSFTAGNELLHLFRVFVAVRGIQNAVLKSKKHPKDMTTEELAKAVFHPKLLKKLKEIAHGKDHNL